MGSSIADALADTGAIPPINASDLDKKNVGGQKGPPTSAVALMRQGEIESKPLEESFAADEKKVPVFPTVENGMLKPPPEKDTSNDPVKGYTSMIGLLGAIGSMFTRRPMTNSMNAAAAAINSTKAGEAEDFKSKMDIWKTENENALKYLDYEQNLYKQVMENDRFSLQEKHAQLTALAAAQKDDVMAAHMKNQDMLGAQQLVLDRQKIAEEAKYHSDEIAGKYPKAYAALQDVEEAKQKLSDAQKALKAGKITKEEYTYAQQESMRTLEEARQTMSKMSSPSDKARERAAEKVGPIIRNQVKNYPDLTVNDLAGIDSLEKRKVEGAFESLDNIEHIADFITKHPESAGIVAEAAKRINLDAIKGLGDNESQEALNSQVGANIDALTKGKGDLASDSKVLSKLLTTQALTDASSFGMRGANQYLASAFQNIYQQASRTDTLVRVLAERARNSQDVLSEVNMNVENSTQKEKYPLTVNGADAFNEKYFKSAMKVYTPEEARAAVKKDKSLSGKTIRIQDADGVHEIVVH